MSVSVWFPYLFPLLSPFLLSRICRHHLWQLWYTWPIKASEGDAALGAEIVGFHSGVPEPQHQVSVQHEQAPPRHV